MANQSLNTSTLQILDRLMRMEDVIREMSEALERQEQLLTRLVQEVEEAHLA